MPKETNRIFKKAWMLYQESQEATIKNLTFSNGTAVFNKYLENPETDIDGEISHISEDELPDYLAGLAHGIENIFYNRIVAFLLISGPISESAAEAEAKYIAIGMAKEFLVRKSKGENIKVIIEDLRERLRRILIPRPTQTSESDTVLLKDAGEFIETLDRMFIEVNEKEFVVWLKQVADEFDKKTPQEKREFARAFLNALEQKQGQLKNIQFLLSAGGKATNSARVLKLLGVRNIPWIGFISKNSVGEEYLRLFPKDGIDQHVILTKEDTRVYISLNAEPDIRLKTPGQEISDEEWGVFLKEFEEMLKKAKKGQWVIMGSSMPKGYVPEDAYTRLIQSAKEKGCYVSLDVHETWPKAAIISALKANPTMIKLSRSEFQSVLDALREELPQEWQEKIDISKSTPEDIAELAVRVTQRFDIKLVMVSLESEGVVLSTNKGTYYSKFEGRVNVKNTIGAGDALVAGFLHSLGGEGTNLKKSLEYGIAVATAMIQSDDSRPFKQQVEEILKQVKPAEVIQGSSREYPFTKSTFPPIHVALNTSVDINLRYSKYSNSRAKRVSRANSLQVIDPSKAGVIHHDNADYKGILSRIEANTTSWEEVFSGSVDTDLFPIILRRKHITPRQISEGVTRGESYEITYEDIIIVPMDCMVTELQTDRIILDFGGGKFGFFLGFDVDKNIKVGDVIKKGAEIGRGMMGRAFNFFFSQGNLPDGKVIKFDHRFRKFGLMSHNYMK